MRSLSLLIRSGIIAGLMSLGFSAPVFADPLESGFKGAIGGAIIGGIVGGGKGAGRGAAIGGALGVVKGAMEESDRRRYQRYRRRYYEPAPVSSQLVVSIQSSLWRLGYNPGPVDGVYGGQTAHAIALYQDEYGLRITRRPSRALLRHMRRNGG